MPGDPGPLTSAAAPSRTRRLLIGDAVATVVVGFVVGFAVGGRGPSGPDDVQTATGTVPPVTSTTAPPPPTSAATTSTSTTSTSTTTSTTQVVTTTAPPPTTVAPVVTVPPTVAPPTVPPTSAPSRVLVSYGADSTGRMVIPRTGSTTLVISNHGGLTQQWLVTGTGFVTLGTSQGMIGPGQTINVVIAAPFTELPTGEIYGILSVLGAVNPTIHFVIPAA